MLCGGSVFWEGFRRLVEINQTIQVTIFKVSLSEACLCAFATLREPHLATSSLGALAGLGSEVLLHSYLNATIGSTFVARRAGIKQARRAAAHRTTAIAI
jgi:hypothetical protein